jgi:hypothetical protein
MPPGRDDNVGDVVHVLDAAGRADDVTFAVLLDVIGAAADVVGLDRRDHLSEREAVADQLRRIGLDLKLLDEAADRICTRDAGHGLHLGPYDPILHRAQIDRAPEIVGQTLALRRLIGAVGLPARLAVAHRCACAGLFVLDRPPVDFAEASRYRSHPYLDARRQVGLGVVDPLGHQLPSEVDVGAVGEDSGDLGKSVPGKRAGRLQPRNTRKRGLKRYCDLLFDFLRRQGRSGCVDLHLDVCHIRNGVDR